MTSPNPRDNLKNIDPLINRRAKVLGVFTVEEMADYFPDFYFLEVALHLNKLRKEGIIERVYGISRMRTTYHYIGRTPSHDQETISKELI